MATFETYCVKEKRFTDCIPGSEIVEIAKNGREMMKCKCASCGATKTTFLPTGKKLHPTMKTMVRDYYNLTGERIFPKNFVTEGRSKSAVARNAKRAIRSRQAQNFLNYARSAAARQDDLLSDQDGRYQELIREQIADAKNAKRAIRSRQAQNLLNYARSAAARQDDLLSDQNRRYEELKVRARRSKPKKATLKITDRFDFVPPQYKMITYDPSYQKAKTDAIVKRIKDEIRAFEAMYDRAVAMGANLTQLNMIRTEIANLNHSLERALLLG